MEYPFLIDDALKSGKGIISPATQNILMDYALTEGASKEQFHQELQNKTSAYYVYQRKTSKTDDHKCTNCGANIPVIARYCDYCGAETGNPIHAEYSEHQVNFTIDNILIRVQKTPKPSFLRTLFGNFYILMPVLLLYLLIIFYGESFGGFVQEVQSYQRSDMEDLMAFLLFAGAFFILLKIILVFAIRKKRIKLIAAKAEYEKLLNIVRFQFGSDNKFKERLDILYSNILHYTRQSKLEDKFKAAIYIVFFVVIGWHSSYYVNYGLMMANRDEPDSMIDNKENPAELYKKMHYNIKATNDTIDGPLKDYLKLEEGEYIAFQKPNHFREDLFVYNVAFKVIKPLPKNTDSSDVYSIHLGLVDKDGKEIMYQDGVIATGFYIKDSEFLSRNMLTKNTKLLLHFDGLLNYRGDSIPHNMREQGLKFTVSSSIRVKTSSN